MTVKDLITELRKQDEDAVAICMDEGGGWDNIEEVITNGSSVAIVFGGGSPFSDDQDAKIRPLQESAFLLP